MKKRITIEVLIMIILLTSLHFYETNKAFWHYYDHSYHLLYQRLYFADRYYNAHGEEDRSELRQTLLLVRGGHDIERYGSSRRVALLYSKFDFVFYTIPFRMPTPEDTPHFYEVLDEITQKMYFLRTEKELKNLTEEEYNEIVGLLDELYNIAFQLEEK